MSIVDRLRELAERLPPGGSLTLTREGLLDLATADDGESEQPAAPADFTVAELASRFHRSASTVRDWCEHGRFEGAYKLNGRDWRVPPAAVDAFLAEQRGEKQITPLEAWRAVRRTPLLRRR
jgi:excisionase family DNA binding protein